MSIHLCVVGLRGFPDVMGGIEAHCEQIYRIIGEKAADFRITVLARSPYVGQGPYTYANCTLKPLWTIKNKTMETALHTLIGVLQARFGERCDVLHVHAIGPGLFIPLAKMLGLKVIATHHGHDYERLKWGAAARLSLRLGEWCMAAFADQIICVSQASTAKLRTAFPHRAHKIHTIPNGAAVARTGETPTGVLEALGLVPQRYILAVGRLVPEKGFQDLIAAFRRADSPYKLVIVGAADHADAFSAELMRSADDRVIFAGRRPRHDLAPLYRHAGLFVLPSYHEGHPIVALEALQARAPVVLSDIVANRDLGLPPHHYVRPGDIDALAELLATADFSSYRVDDPLILARYDWQDIASQTLEVMRATVEPGRHRRALAQQPG